MGKLTTLHSFDGNDGAYPFNGLIQASNGDFYGTTSQYGLNGYGTIFKLTPAGVLTTLHSFDGNDGYYAYDGLLQATDGNFYGTTNQGGASGWGTVFRLSVGLTPFVTFIRYSGKVGQTAQILGQGFTGTAGVSFNGTPAAFTVRSDTYLTASVPAGATTGFVTVNSVIGAQKSAKIFRVLPLILSFSPTSGPPGTKIVITGKSFTQATAVWLDCQHRMSFTVDSDTQITAIVPNGSPSGRIGVTTSGGKTESAASFTVTQ